MRLWVTHVSMVLVQKNSRTLRFLHSCVLCVTLQSRMSHICRSQRFCPCPSLQLFVASFSAPKRCVIMKVTVAATQMACSWDIEANLVGDRSVDLGAARSPQLLILQWLRMLPVKGPQKAGASDSQPAHRPPPRS